MTRKKKLLPPMKITRLLPTQKAAALHFQEKKMKRMVEVSKINQLK